MLTPEALLLHLSEFAPARPRAAADAWRRAAELAPPHGVAPLLAYNVEYRLAGAGAPPEVRDALLGHYQGALADNVLKLVSLKKMLAEVEGRKVLLLDAAAFADALYPHVAFRPLGELRLLAHAADVGPLQRAFAEAGFGPRGEPDPLGGAAVSSDDRTRLVLHTRLFPEARAAEEARLWERALPYRAFGTAALRPALEDALLSAALLLARQGFDAPLVTLIDLRELVRGAPDLGGPYSRPPDAAQVRERARLFKLERALWVATELVARLWPATADAARALQPDLRPASRALLNAAVVEPASDLARTRAFRGAERLRKLLAGG